MILLIDNAIEENTLAVLLEALQDATWADGRQSAGTAAKTVKNNQQITLLDGEPKALRLLFEHLQKLPILQQAALPKSFAKVMLNQYQQGMEYGWHVDNAFINNTRSDMSFTLSLSDANSYQGGELVLQDTSGERSFKLNKGQLLLYPSTYLHKVNAVTSGTRQAMVGWVESRIKCPQQREIVFDIQQAASHELNTQGKTAQYDSLSKSYQNLLRLWAN